MSLQKWNYWWGCRNKIELKKTEKFLDHFEIIKLNSAISDLSIDLLKSYNLSHGLMIPDALIAATSISEGNPFATKNLRDFKYIKDLDLVQFP